MYATPHVPSHFSKEFWISFLVFGIVWWFSKEDYFFWDSIQLSSKQATFFYESPDWSLILPPDIDSGHFPLMGIYLSAWWLGFGKTLFVSHIAMLPWILMLAWNIGYLTNAFFHASLRPLVTLIICLDPTLLAQMSLVSPDIILMAMAFSCITFYRLKKPFYLALTWLVLSLISMRGGIVAATLTLAFLGYEYHHFKKVDWKLWTLTVLPAIFCNLVFFTYHYRSQQWVGFHQDSPWALSFTAVSIAGWIKNIALIAWRFLDFGRVGIWILLLFLAVRNAQKFKKQDIHFWLLVSVCLVFTFTAVTSGFQGLTSHRYFLPAYISLVFLTTLALQETSWATFKKRSILLGLSTLLISGHFWRYPDNIAQGWDASLAYKPIFSIWDETQIYLTNNQIEPQEVGSFFPFLSENRFVTLQADSDRFTEFNEEVNHYLFLSNITNDAPDSLYQLYPWSQAEFYVQKGMVKVGIFKIK